MIQLLAVLGLAGGALWWATRDKSSSATTASASTAPAYNKTPGLNLQYMALPGGHMAKVEFSVAPGPKTDNSEFYAKLGVKLATDKAMLATRQFILVWESPDKTWGVVSAPSTPQPGEPPNPWPPGVLFEARRKTV